MKCKRHPYVPGPGVCATCLRERLLSLLAARDGRSPDRRRSLEPPPPPPPDFPRSVSPYVAHRRSLGSGSSNGPQHCRRRFFSTPQVGPSTAAAAAAAANSEQPRRKKFSIFSALFGFSRSDDEIRSSRSWISNLFRRSRSRPRLRSSEPFQERGMSPIDGDGDDSACSSGYSTDSGTGWRRPEPTPVRRLPVKSRHLSGFAVCLSPLVRPSSKPAADLGISGDSQHHRCSLPHRRHVSAGAASLVPSGSRKLADHGRFR